MKISCFPGRFAPPPLIGGENIQIENNHYGCAVSAMPEFILPAYRGNFQAAVRFTGFGDSFQARIGVFDTAFADLSDSASISSAGTLYLRWQEIAPGNDPDSHFSLPRWRKTTVAAMPARSIAADSWIWLKMSRTANNVCDYSFTDDYLGTVNLNFSWEVTPTIPSATPDAAVLVVAAVRVASASGQVEILQQHHGVGTLWIPLESGAFSDSSSASESFDWHDPFPSDSESYSEEYSDSFYEPDNSESVEDSESPSESQCSDSQYPPDDSDSMSSNSGSRSNSTPPPDGSDSASGSASTVLPASIRVDYYYTADNYLLAVEPPLHDGSIITLGGSFTPSDTAPAAGYEIVMNGQTIAIQDGSDPQISALQQTFQVCRNPELGRWELRANGQLLSELEYHNSVEPETDSSDLTDLYIFPLLAANPNYPLGTMEARETILGGISTGSPSYRYVYHVTITFTAVPAGGEA